MTKTNRPNLTTTARFSQYLSGHADRTPRTLEQAVQRLTLLQNPSRLEPVQQAGDPHARH